MKQLVLIKSYHKGLSIFLDEYAPMDEICKELADKFSSSASFFRDAHMVITFENRILSEEEEERLVDVITENCDIHVNCIVGKNPHTEKLFLKAIEQMEVHSALSAKYAQVYTGNLTDGAKIDCVNSVILLGDVYPGCLVRSEKDIYIFGGLFGEANAGSQGEKGHFVVAQEMSPERLKIGEYRYHTSEKSRWPIKSKPQPKIAYEEDGTVQIVSYTKEFLAMHGF